MCFKWQFHLFHQELTNVRVMQGDKIIKLVLEYLLKIEWFRFRIIFRLIMVHKLLTIWDATCTTAAMLLSLLLLAAATVLSTSVLVEDSAVGDKAAMLMVALLVSLLLPSTPVVAFEALQTTSVVPLEKVAPLPVLLLTVGLAVLPPVALEGVALLTVLFPLIPLSSMVGSMVTPTVALEGAALSSPASVPGERIYFEVLGCWVSPPTANGAAPFRAAFASHGGSIVCCWIWCRMEKVVQKGKDSGSWTLPKWVVPKFPFVGIRTLAKSSWELAFSLNLSILLT